MPTLCLRDDKEQTAVRSLLPVTVARHRTHGCDPLAVQNKGEIENSDPNPTVEHGADMQDYFPIFAGGFGPGKSGTRVAAAAGTACRHPGGTRHSLRPSNE
jgi:hypothetical protein